MIKLSNRLSFFLMFLMLFFTVISSYAQLVTNGSFESSSTGVVNNNDVKGWLIQVADGVNPSPVFEIVGDTVEQGNRALKVTVQGLGSNQWDIQIVADSIPVTPNATYNYSIWAKAEKAGAQVNFTVGNYSYSEYKAIRPANLTTQWKEYTMQFTITDDQEIIRAPIHFNYTADIGNAIYIDNLQIVDVNAGRTPVIVEAESGRLGSSFSILQDGNIACIKATTDYTGLTNPGDTSHVATYQVTFQDTGSYNLFVRLCVGPGRFDDDSFFYGNGFGEKACTNDGDWIFVNMLAAAGFSGPNEVVHELGGLGSQVWKWVNISNNFYPGSAALTFKIVEDSLTKTFQIGSREDGLEIDKIAFGKSSLYYTVGNLDNGEAGSSELPGNVWEGPPLACNQPKFVGNVYCAAQAPNFEAYWNQVTPENASKWGSVEGVRDNMNWSGIDAAYNFAKDNGFPFHFHVLIWGAQQPSWISALAPAEQLEEIREWFQAVADRYPDIDFLEVVNEPLPGHNPPDGTSGRANYKQALGGDGVTGWDWVLNAFRMAREIFPSKTRLMLNDFNIISSSSSTSQYLKLIRLLQAENLIDIIGEQGHAFTTTASVVTMKKNLDSLAATGLPIQITELDIDGPSDVIQLQSYQRIFPALYEHPGVEGITLWGWRRGCWRDAQGAYIFNQDGSERPALEWLRQYLDTLNIKPVSVEEIVEKANEFRLDDNYPNPFNSSTQIQYAIPQSGYISLKVYNLLGEEIMTLFEGVQQAGSYIISFDGAKFASGVYLYQLKANNLVETKKLILLK